MAQMVNSSMSAEKCLDASERHEHLATQTYGVDNGYTTTIKPKTEQLKGKMLNYRQARKDQVFKYDEVVLCNRKIDNIVRQCFEQTRQYVRSNGDDILLATFFPSLRFGDVIYKKREPKLHAVNDLAYQYDRLDPEHPLYHFGTELQSAVNNFSVARTAHNDLKQIASEAMIEVDKAKEDLVKQYETNYLTAKQKLGRDRADAIFPIIYKKKSDNDIVEGEENNE